MFAGKYPTRLAVILGLGFLACGQAVASACAAGGHRQFDFWLGQWQVHTPDGKLAGINQIAVEYDGCVLHERYTTGRGYSGESINVYDASRQVWHQTWVDSTGLLLLLEGGISDGSMVLEGQTLGADGLVTRHRITWKPNADGTVRQLWESIDQAGQPVTVFDGLYTRRQD